MRLSPVLPLALALLAPVRSSAQQAPSPPPPAPAEIRAPAPAHPARKEDESGSFDPQAVARGRDLMVQQCGFCHGSNARGGQQGPDLTRSDLVQSDENGQQLGAFLKVGRPELKMPRFDLPEKDVADLATFLHATIQSVSNRGDYKILDIVVGDPKAGAAFFNGAGQCHTCHSPTADLSGVGSRYPDPATLQGRLVMPRGRARRGPPRGGDQEKPPYLDDTAVKATVTLASGEAFTGPLVRLTDFDVTVYDAALEQTRSWLRTNGVPAVTLQDPLQAHVDQLRRWTDTDIHNLTAFLVTLK